MNGKDRKKYLVSTPFAPFFIKSVTFQIIQNNQLFFIVFTLAHKIVEKKADHGR